MTKSSANTLAELRKMSTPIPINSNANTWQLRNPHQFDDSTPYESGMMDQCVSQNSVSPSHSLSPTTALAYNAASQQQQQQQHLQQAQLNQQQHQQQQQHQLIQGGSFQKMANSGQQPNIVIGNSLTDQLQQHQHHLGSAALYQQQQNDSSSNLSAYNNSSADYLGNLESNSSTANNNNNNMQLPVDLESLLVNATLSESSSCDPINENDDSNASANLVGHVGQLMSPISNNNNSGNSSQMGGVSNDVNDESANMNSMNPSFLFNKNTQQQQRQLNSHSPNSPSPSSSSSDFNNNNANTTNNNNNNNQQSYFMASSKKSQPLPSGLFMGSPRSANNSAQNKQRINYKIEEEQLDENANANNNLQPFKFSNYDQQQQTQIIQIPSSNNNNNNNNSSSSSPYYQSNHQHPSMSLPTDSILTNLYHHKSGSDESAAGLPAANLLFNPHHHHHHQQQKAARVNNFDVAQQQQQQQQQLHQQRSASNSVLNQHHQQQLRQPSLGIQSQHQRSDPVLTQLALNSQQQQQVQSQQQQQQQQLRSNFQQHQMPNFGQQQVSNNNQHQQQQFFVHALPITTGQQQQQQQLFNANNFVNNPPIDSYQQQQQHQQMASMSLPSNYSSFMNMDFVEYKNANIINEEDATAAKLNGSSNDSGIASSYNSSGAGANNIQIKKEIVDEQYEKSMNPSNISAIDDNDERFSKLQLSSPIQPSSINDLDDMSAVLFDVGVDLNTTFEGLGGNDQQQQQQQANMNQVLLDSFGQNMLQEETSSNALMGRDVGLQQNMIKIEDEAAAGAAYNEETYDYDEEDDEDDEDDDDFDDEDEDDDEFDDYEDEDEYGGGGNGDDEHFAFETSEELGGGDVRLMAMRGINIGTAAGRGGGSAKASQPLMVGSVGSSLTPSLLRRNLAALPTTTTNSSSSHSRKHARIANTDADVHANMKAQHQQQSSQQQHMNRLMTSNSNNLFSNIQFQPFNSSQQQQQLPMAQNTFIQQQQQANQGNFGYLSTSLPASTSLLDSKMFVMNNNNNFIQYQQPMVPNAPFQFQAVHQAPQAPSPSSSFLSSQNNPINHPNLHKLLNNNSASNNVITLPTIHPSSKLAANVVFDASSAQNPGQLMDNVAVAAGAGAKTTKTAPRARQTKQQAAVATVQIQKAPQRKRQQKKQDLYDDDDDDENDDSNDGSELSDDENNSNEKYADSDSEANNNAYSSGRNGAGGGGGGLSSSVNSEMLFDLMMSTKNRDSYFWQYNIQSKGPKTRKVLTLRNKDPHLHREFFDPVYQLQTLNSRQGTAVNKLRKGDGNDVTPNPEKLYNLGNQIRDFIQKSYQMNSAIFQPQGHAQQLASSPSSFNLNQLSTTPNGGSSSVGDTAMVGGVRVNLKREKNKIASRACRLKKKAQHEANKLKLSGLNDEHKQLIDCISMARDLIKTRLKEPQKIPQDKKMIDLIDDLIKKNLKTKVAGHSDAYVHGLMLNVERERSKTGHGGLFDLSQPINQPQGVAGAANRFSSNLQFSGSNNTIEEL